MKNRTPRKLKKKNKKRGLLNPDLHKKVFSLLYPKKDNRWMLDLLKSKN